MSDYEFVTSDVQTIVASLVQKYEAISGVTVRPASPERLFIEWVAAIIVQERVNINYAANQNIPSRATGQNLDALAEFFAVPGRPPAKKAVCTILFTLSSVQASDVSIPIETQVTDSSGAVVFATDATVTIPAGETQASVSATCTKPGTFANGYTAGQIYAFANVMPDYIASAVNTDTTAGGSEEATDDEFFRLMKLSLATYSTAGAQAAYEYFARSVSEDIGNVVVTRPARISGGILPVVDVSGTKYIYLGGDTIKESSILVKSADGTTTYEEDTDYEVVSGALNMPGMTAIQIKSGSALESAATAQVTFTEDMAGHVAIYAMTDEGEPVSAALKARILAACSARNVRPLTDYVSVEDPDTYSYTVNVTYYGLESSEESTATLAQKVTAAVNDYVKWQSGKLGRDINPSKLIQLVMAAGAKRVEVTAPTYEHISDGTDGGVPMMAVLSGTPTITYGGLEDE